MKIQVGQIWRQKWEKRPPYRVLKLARWSEGGGWWACLELAEEGDAPPFLVEPVREDGTLGPFWQPEAA